MSQEISYTEEELDAMQEERRRLQAAMTPDEVAALAAMSLLTGEQFRDNLREGARNLVSGFRDEIAIPLSFIESGLEVGMTGKVTQSYVRNIMNRVPEVIAAGKTIRVKVNKQYEKGPAMVMTATEGRSEKQRQESDIKRREKAAHMREFMGLVNNLMPDTAGMSDEEIVATVRTVNNYRDLIASALGVKKDV